MPRGHKAEINTGDISIPQPPPINMPALGEDFEHQTSSIEAIDKMPDKDYMKELQFNEDILTIRLERSSEKYAPKHVQVACNGQTLWLQVGKEIKIARKFVEILAESKPMDVVTDVIEKEGQDPINNINRHVRAAHPFSVIHDPSPKGAAWLTWLMNRG